MNKIYPRLILFFIFLAFAQKGISQLNAQAITSKLKSLQIFAKDSLTDFDEVNYRAMALYDGFVGDEYSVFMYNQKRAFIDRKYNLSPPQNQNNGGGGRNGGGNIMAYNGGGGNQIMVAPCVNEGFEATPPGQYTSITGWTINEGQNGTSFGGQYYNTCSVAVMPVGIFSLVPSEFWIRSTPIADGNFPGGIAASPLGGNNVAQLNNSLTASGQITKMSQTFPVTASNCVFRFAYAACFNGTGHLCCDQPFLNIKVKNCANVVLACPQVSVIASGPSCTLGTPGFLTNGFGYLYRNWTVQAISLQPYIGTCVTIEVAVGDCSGWAHFGYCYFDSECAPMDLVVNGVVFPAGINATTVSACSLGNATIVAPPNLGPYNWMGPPGSGIVNSPSQTIITNVSGNYTLTMNPIGACAPIIQTVTLLFSSPPVAGFSVTNLCNVFTFSNTGSPAPAVQTYSFAGPAPPASYTTSAATSSLSFPTPGTYTVTQVMTNTAGCTATAQVVIVVPAAPNAAFSINSHTQCLTGNSFSFTAASPGGVHGYTFSPAAGAPPVGNTPNYGFVSFTLPGTYTVTHGVTVGACTSFSTDIVVINPMPTPTVSNNGPVCLNTPIILSASGGTSYAWSGPLGYVSAVQNPTIVNATLAMSGAYTVLVTSAVGCTATAVTNVTVYALPSPSITSNSPVCVGTVLTLTASGGSNYVWTGPNAFTSTLTSPVINNVSLAASGIYTLLAGGGNCTVLTTASITVNPLPNPIIGSNSPVCLNQPLNLSSGGGTQYAWAGPGGYSSLIQNPIIPVSSMTNSGVYTVNVTDANTCSKTATTNVVINALPILVVNNPTNCVNSTIFLTSAGALNYAWTGPLGYTSGFQNPSIPFATVPMSGQYTVLGTSAAGCTSTAVSNVSVSPSPTAVIVSNNPVCFGKTLTLNGSGGGTYLWTGPNGFTTINSNNVINNVTLPANGTYSLLVTVNTCTNLATLVVTINPLPIPVIQLNNPVCFNSPITFTGTGGVTYTWTGPGGFNSTFPSPVILHASVANTGIYNLVTKDVNGCVNSTTASAVVLPLPVISVQGSTVCLGNTATLAVQSDPGAIYNWMGPNGFVSTTTVNLFPNLTYSTVGLYTVVVTGTNQCSDVSVASVTNFPPPVPTASNSGPVCLNDKVDFTSEGGFVYQWTGPNQFLNNNQNTTLLSANSMDDAGTYTLGVIDNKGCQGFTTTRLEIRALPSGTVKPSADKFCVPFCSGFSVVSPASIQATYWTMNSGGSAYAPIYNSCFTKPGSYALISKFTDNFGCSNTSTLMVNAYPVPIADFHFGPGDPIENQDVIFTDNSRGEYINGWTWFFGANNKISLHQNPTHLFEEPGAFAVALIAENKWGCKDTVVKPIVIGEDFNIFVPNAFTPDGDGLNDLFQPKGHGIVSYDLMVFDRWGEKLFHTNDFSKGWDGMFRGTLSKEDTYVWQIVVKNKEGKSKELKGIVTLIR